MAYLLASFCLFPQKKDTLKLYWSASWVRHGLQVGSSFLSSFLQSGVTSALSVWESPIGIGWKGIRGCGLPLEDAYFAHALSMLERNKGMQECVWGLTHLPVEGCSYTCLHLPVGAGAYSRLFHCLCQGADQEAWDQCTEKSIWCI